MTFTVPHYVPSFLWQFWLSNSGQTRTRKPRLHVYDVHNGELLELKTPPAAHRPVFQDFDSALDASTRSELVQATRWFSFLESKAEAALSKMIKLVHHDSPVPSQISMESSEMSTIIQFFVFLRFRNSTKYQEMIKQLMEPSDVSLSWSTKRQGIREKSFSIYSPIYRQVRLVTILTAFTRFFTADIEHLPLSPFPAELVSRSRKDPCLKIVDTYFWQPCRQVEMCLGVSSEEDVEYILSGSCYGVLDDSFGSGASGGTGTGPEQNPETESYDFFFPILPNLALYFIRLDEDFTTSGSGQVSVDIGQEMAIDIHLRNAMVLSNVPYHQNQRHTDIFIPYNRMSPTIQLEDPILRISSSESESASVAMSISEEAAAALDNISNPLPLLPIESSGSTTFTAEPDLSATAFDINTGGPKLYFHSLSSITKSISSYDEFRCRWIADKFIDYSRLKQRCRQKFCMEGVMKVLPIKQDIVVIDLTDEVQIVGDEPVAFGAFSDVWKGQWHDRVERRDRAVAIKYLRGVMVRKVTRDKLVKRLQAEIVTWHQLCHRNLATLFGIIQNSNSIGMVSLWCGNGTLGRFLRKNPDRNRLRLLVQVASGVAYLHHFNPPVVHGDLKGSNILIDENESPLITDFGLSKVMEDLTSSLSDEDGNEAKMVSTSFFAGSTRWMAPELILALVEDEGKIPQVTTHSDVYAFASVCLEIATGQLPYPKRTNDHAVTLDILRGVGPSAGAVFGAWQLGIGNGKKLSSSSSTSSSGSPTTPKLSSLPLLVSSKPGDPAEGIDREEEHDVFRDILERCWDSVPYLRPSMEEVLKCFVEMET